MRPFRGVFAGAVSTAIIALPASAVLLAFQSSAPEKATPARPARQYTIEQFLDSTAIQGWRATFSADESRILFSSNKSGVWNAYTMPVSGGDWTPVTTSTTTGTYGVSFFPHDNRLLLSRGHIYVRDVDGTERDLTPGDRVRGLFLDWTREGDAFFLFTNERDVRAFDIYRYDGKTYARTMFFENKDGYELGHVSPDARWVALPKASTTNDSDIDVLNVASKQTRRISQHTGAARYEIAGFDRDSKYLYFVTDAGREFMALHRYSLADGTTEPVLETEWDVVSSSFSPRGRFRTTIVNADGRRTASVIEAATGAPVALPAVPNASIDEVRFSRSETKMLLSVTGDRSPNSLYVFDVRTGKLTRLIDSLNPMIDAADLVDAQVVRFKARDGMEIPNILWKPHQASSSNKAPAIVWVHGGPGDQTRPAYRPFIQYLVNHGYVVLGINNRGSSGYGKAFYAADDKKHGKEPLWDCVDAKNYLQTLSYVDPRRIGIAGESYGGYMVLAALAFQPEEFNAGVNFFGVGDWIRYLEDLATRVSGDVTFAEIGHPINDREMLQEISPLFHASQIRKPLLVLHGAKDPRVQQVQSDDIVAAVKKNGVPVEYLLFPDEGHGFVRKSNLIAAYGGVLQFLNRYLK